jgi:hypothetical protein
MCSAAHWLSGGVYVAETAQVYEWRVVALGYGTLATLRGYPGPSTSHLPNAA